MAARPTWACPVALLPVAVSRSLPGITVEGDAAQPRAGAFVRPPARAAYTLTEEVRMIPVGNTGDMPYGTKPAAWDTLRAGQQ